MNTRFFAICISIMLAALVICFVVGCTSSVTEQGSASDSDSRRETEPAVSEEAAQITEEPTEQPPAEPTAEPEPTPEPTPTVLLHVLSLDPTIDWDNWDPEAYDQYLDDLCDQYYSAEVMDDDEMLDIPYYYDSDVWWPYMYGFGYDTHSFINVYGEIWGYIEQFPDAALRKTSDGRQYLVIGWENGCRWYVFLMYSNGLYFARYGHAVVVKDIHSYEDFKDVKIGDTIDAVCAVDSVAEQYKAWAAECFDEGSEYSASRLREMDRCEANGMPFSSIHYLSDGILVFRYHRNENNEMVISNIIYSEDYILPDAMGLGRDINYRILDIDLP